MKDEDKKIREIFNRGIDRLNDGTPDFWTMMDKVVEKSGNKNWVTWKVAASVLLIIGLGIFIIVRNHGKPDRYSLIEWNEPTRELMILTFSGSSATLSSWSSPTDFLLTNNTQQIRN